MPQRNSKNGKVQKRRQKGNALFNYGPTIHAQQRAIRVILPWSWTGNLAEGVAGAGSINSFALNNAFDPYFTGVGSQPLAYDQYSALYARYRVLGVKFRLIMGQRGTTDSRVGCYPSAQSTLPADVNAWPIQNQWAKLKYMGPNAGGNNVAEFNGRVDLAAVLGVTKNEFVTEHDFVAATGSGPARICYFHVFTLSASGIIAACDYTLMLWLEVEFMSPVALSLS